MTTHTLRRFTMMSLGAVMAVYTVIAPFSSLLAVAADTQSSPSSNTSTTSTEEKPDLTYYQNADGTWENDDYVWNPDSRQTAPKQDVDYSYNPDTERWDTEDWAYSADSGSYVENKKPQTSPSPTPSSTTTTEPLTTTNQPATAPSTTGSAVETTSAQTNQPTESSAVLQQDQRAAYFDLYYNADISNNIISNARSGDASVIYNTVAGDATSGSAITQATLVNILQSSWGGVGQDIVTFSANLEGDVYGDLSIDPSQLMQTSTNSHGEELTINAVNDIKLDNNVDVASYSGDATVANNTTAGSATSGNATALVNILNLVNSMINFGQSFVGTINIHDNFVGDILLPDGVLESLLAQNNQTAGTTAATETDIDVVQDVTIENNITADATSGQATVSNNTTAGDATTGNAQTQVNIFNLAGSNIVASNSLLVFVNVFGEWLGIIAQAPGADSAMFGSGVRQTNTVANDTDVAIDNTVAITNDVTARAHSGDALVDSNTAAGDATTGDATVGVNIANITNSSLSFTDWFGVLFINVFGDWSGSFGVDTPYGDPVAGTPAPTNAPSAGGNSGHPSSAGSGASGVFGFTPSTAQTAVALGQQQLTPSASTATDSSESQVAAATSTQPQDPRNPEALVESTSSIMWWLLLTFGGVGLYALRRGGDGQLSPLSS